MQIRDKFCLELTGKSIRTILNLSEGVNMIERNKLIEPEKVSCEVCLKEIPISEASSVKATDYIKVPFLTGGVYICSLELGFSSIYLYINLYNAIILHHLKRSQKIFFFYFFIFLF